jgi:Ca2+-binding RTX toxin-like protein
MTTTIVTTVVAGFTMSAHDVLYESTAGVITGRVDMTDGGTSGGGELAQINGGVFGGLFDNTLSSGNDSVTIAATGYIDTTTFAVAAIDFGGGGGDRISNAGTLSALFGPAIILDGGSGGFASVADTIVNTGLISSSMPATGSAGGAISASGVAKLFIDNSGVISGPSDANVQNAIYVTSTGGGAVINNSGRIVGGISVQGGPTRLDNTGAILGDIALSGAGGSVVNDGRIVGDVTLIGDATFNSSGGKVYGTITGGAGADTIHLGNNGETVNGGAGHDRIYGGTGADAFAFTSFAAADYDRVFGFNVANDTIQLDHTVFTKLTAGVTPVFAIASSATSASDHLFYNSTTGWLSYDPDGNGAQAAHGFVNLGAGLKLTANNFTVV